VTSQSAPDSSLNELLTSNGTLQSQINKLEKIQEEMITASDSYNTYDMGQYFVILPQATDWDKNEFLTKFNAKPVEKGFCYNSGTNDRWETVESLRGLIKQHVDFEFTV
jgi:FlaA1/EpsC-like NDP-sugar epimerase